MKLGGGIFGKSTYKKGSGFSRGPSRAAPTPAPFAATPTTYRPPSPPTYSPPAPATYGGPPGSFITRGRTCPVGYSSVPLPRVGNSPAEYRCVPKPRPVQVPVSPSAPSSPILPAPRITVSPPITVNPIMTQSFTPQISPVFQQVQDSPGASQTAIPVQDVDTTQKGETSGPTATIPQERYLPITPYVPIAPMPAPPPSVVRRDIEPEPEPERMYIPVSPEIREGVVAEQEKSDLPLLLAVGGIALFMLTKS